MKNTIKQWGNSAALRIPTNVLREVGIDVGTAVELKAVGNSLVITPTACKKKYVLAELLEGITPENRHDFIDFGEPVGLENITYERSDLYA